MQSSSKDLNHPIILVGGGQAAATACVTLRSNGFDGELIIISNESTPPYQRPPLSKAYLKGGLTSDRLLIKPLAWYEKQQVTLHLDETVTAIDRANQQISTSKGSYRYSRLILATGSRPRTLPLAGNDANGVFQLRSVSDVDKLRSHLTQGSRLVVIGAGYIGLEAAASARALGVEVTVLEYAPRVLARVTGEKISEFFQTLHASQGVTITTNARIEEIRTNDGAVTGVALKDGTVIDADVVLMGVGISPNIELAEAAGVVCNNGIAVDRDARSSDPNIYAAGDCTSRELVHYHRDGRLESVHNAVEQGKLAAAHILGLSRPAEDAPWFWSDQYHIKLQIAGLSAGFDEQIVRGDPSSESFTLFYLKEGKLLAADAINASPEFVFSRKLITHNAKINPEQLADLNVPMKEIAAAALK